MSIGLLIVDGHDGIRDGLRTMFTHGDITIVAEARKPWEVGPRVREHANIVLLLSVSWGRFRDEDRIEILREIRVAANPDVLRIRLDQPHRGVSPVAGQRLSSKASTTNCFPKLSALSTLATVYGLTKGRSGRI